MAPAAAPTAAPDKAPLLAGSVLFGDSMHAGYRGAERNFLEHERVSLDKIDNNTSSEQRKMVRFGTAGKPCNAGTSP